MRGPGSSTEIEEGSHPISSAELCPQWSPMYRRSMIKGRDGRGQNLNLHYIMTYCYVHIPLANV